VYQFKVPLLSAVYQKKATIMLTKAMRKTSPRFGEKLPLLVDKSIQFPLWFKHTSKASSMLLQLHQPVLDRAYAPLGQHQNPPGQPSQKVHQPEVVI
jgi:hypothetical protein